MAKKQNKQWDGITSVLRVLGAFAVLWLLFFFFVDPGFNPLYVGNRSNARRASCQSNMKQLGLALIQYSQDYDQTLPIGSNTAGQGWREAIYPFVKTSGVYHCPDDSRDYSSYSSSDNLPKSYAANALCFGNGHKPVALASLSAKAILVADTRGNTGEEWDMTSPAFLPNTGCELYAHIPRHLFYEHLPGHVNCLFADGHVKWLAPADTLAPVNLWTPNAAPFAGQDLVNAQAILTHAGNE